MATREEFLAIYCAALNGFLANGHAAGDAEAEAAEEAAERVCAMLDTQYPAPATLRSPAMPPPMLPAAPSTTKAELQAALQSTQGLHYAAPSMPVPLTAESACPICSALRDGPIPVTSPAAPQCQFLHYHPHGNLRFGK